MAEAPSPIKVVAVNRDEGCKGCGMCCYRGPCIVCLMRHPKMKSWNGCPDLTWDGKRHWCRAYFWRQALRAVGLIEGNDRCIHAGNPWKTPENLEDRTKRTTPPLEKLQERLLLGVSEAWLNSLPTWLTRLAGKFAQNALHLVERGTLMRLVIVESPYAGSSPEEIDRHEKYARACMSDCLRRGESPYASHLLYTQPGVLRDGVPEERALGIRAGFAWRAVSDLTAVYEDLGITSGMRQGIEDAEKNGRQVEYRTLEEWGDS